MRIARIPLAALLACACGTGTQEGDTVPTCETAVDSCVRGGGVDVCCSDRGCSWVSWDGKAFANATHAWNYCGVTPDAIPLMNPSNDGTGGTVTPAGPLDDPDDGTNEAPGTTSPSDPATGSSNSSGSGSSGSSGGSSSGSSSGGACYGSPVSCSARYTSGSCEQDYAGCFWEPSYCSGAAYSCGYFTTASGCNAQGGCSWSYYYNDCRGGSWQCHQRPNPGSCYDQWGCYWVEGGCFGSAGNCGGRSSISSCNGVAGCYWQ